MQTVSDRDVHDQEVETLGRKLTEAEREAAAANVCAGLFFMANHAFLSRHSRCIAHPLSIIKTMLSASVQSLHVLTCEHT